VRALVIEDEWALREQLVRALAGRGFAVDGAPDGEEGLYMGREYAVDVAIVDLGLPGISGVEVIRTLRAEGRTFPILILTARERWQDKVEGLDAGADDYLVKPFRQEELMARVNALLRRANGWASPEIELGPVRLNMASQQVSVDGNAVELTAFEYKVLEYLMLHAGEVVSKTDLIEHLYDQDYDRDSNVLEVFVGRLRRKIDPDGNYRPIQTLRGRGYRFSVERAGG
jgi:two-component system response regulator PhoP